MSTSHFISDHAKKRAHTRGISQSAFRDVYRQALRTGVKSSLEEQHKKLTPMLTEKKLNLKIGASQYEATTLGITTRLDVDGSTFAVGIRRVGDVYSSLTCVTTWN